MDMKEKLVELVGGDMCKDCYCEDCVHENNEKACIEHIKRRMADHLIAHGVTVQAWISVKDRLPEKDGHYLCNYHFGEYPKMTFTQVLNYYATDIVPHFQHTLGDGSMKVTHWMEIPKLPQPPKGE